MLVVMVQQYKFYIYIYLHIRTQSIFIVQSIEVSNIIFNGELLAQTEFSRYWHCDQYYYLSG